MYRKCSFSWIRAASVLALSGLAVGIAYGLATEQFGNAPLAVGNYSNWPGIMPVINSKCRVYQRWVNGNENLFYVGDMDALNSFLQDYSSATVSPRKVIITERAGNTTSLGGKSIVYNWEVHLISGIAAWAPGGPGPLDPLVIVYSDGKVINSGKLAIPQNIKVER